MLVQRLITCPLSTFVGILPCRRYTMGLVSKAADMCCRAGQQSRLNNGDASSGPSKIPRCDGMDWARACEIYT